MRDRAADRADVQAGYLLDGGDVPPRRTGAKATHGLSRSRHGVPETTFRCRFLMAQYTRDSECSNYISKIDERRKVGFQVVHTIASSTPHVEMWLNGLRPAIPEQETVRDGRSGTFQLPFLMKRVSGKTVSYRLRPLEVAQSPILSSRAFHRQRELHFGSQAPGSASARFRASPRRQRLLSPDSDWKPIDVSRL